MHLVGMQDPGLQILPTHRLVSGLPTGLTSSQVMAALQSHCEIEIIGQGDKAAEETWGLIEADGGQDVFGFGTTADGQWLMARVTDSSSMATLAANQTEDWRSLGVSVLHKLLLEDLLFKAVVSDPQFQYVHRLDEATRALSTKSHQLACLVAPASIDHVRMIAAARETMPPKSTYFYPKLLSGMVIHSLS